MTERAMLFCSQGENCSRAILRAAAEEYGFPLSEELLNSCNAISAGFGVGGMCSALVAAVMVLGILFPTEEAKQKSLLLFCKMQERWHCIDCCRLSANRENCNDLIGEISEILEEVIRE